MRARRRLRRTDPPPPLRWGSPIPTLGDEARALTEWLRESYPEVDTFAPLLADPGATIRDLVSTGGP